MAERRSFGRARAIVLLMIARVRALRMTARTRPLSRQHPSQRTGARAHRRQRVGRIVVLDEDVAHAAVDGRSWLVPGLLCAALYFAMSYPLSRLARRLEARVGAPR